MAIEEDTKAGLDPADRPPAPQPLWDLFVRTHHGGTRIAPGDVDRLATSAHREDLVIAAVMLHLRLRLGAGGSPRRL